MKQRFYWYYGGKNMFYEFNQNNPGGWFEENDKLCARLFIEADNEREAVLKAEELGCYWDGVLQGIDCSGRGDRWYEPDEAEEFPIEEEVRDYFSLEQWNEKYGKYNVIEEPIKRTTYLICNCSYYEGKIRFDNIEEYAQFLAIEYGGRTSPEVRVFYKDGNVKDFYR